MQSILETLEQCNTCLCYWSRSILLHMTRCLTISVYVNKSLKMFLSKLWAANRLQTSQITINYNIILTDQFFCHHAGSWAKASASSQLVQGLFSQFCATGLAGKGIRNTEWTKPNISPYLLPLQRSLCQVTVMTQEKCFFLEDKLQAHACFLQ